jgi:hypothetical protein
MNTRSGNPRMTQRLCSKQRRGNESWGESPLGRTKTTSAENIVSTPDLFKSTGRAGLALGTALSGGGLKVPHPSHTIVNSIRPCELADLYNREGIRFENDSTPSTPNAPHQCHVENVPCSNRRDKVWVVTVFIVSAWLYTKGRFFPRRVRVESKSSSNAPNPLPRST